MDLFKFIKQTFSEDNGNPSAMRFITFLIVGVILFNWTFINIQTGVMAPLGYQEIMALLGPLGFKAWQKGSEGTPQEDEKK